MKQPTQHPITNPNPTQVCHPPPAVRRGTAIVAVAAIVLVPTALLANRIVAKSDVTAQAGIVEEEPAASAVAHEFTFAAAPVTVPSSQQAIAASCGLICGPDMGALWQQVGSASGSDARTEVVAEAIRSMLRAIDDAVAAAAPALP